MSQHLEALFLNKEIIGVGAFINHELMGYLYGEVNQAPHKKSIVVSYEGVALKTGYLFELLRSLYAHAAKLWVSQDIFEHIVLVPLANTHYYRAFQHLGFAIEQVYAVLDVEKHCFSDEKK